MHLRVFPVLYAQKCTLQEVDCALTFRLDLPLAVGLLQMPASLSTAAKYLFILGVAFTN